MGRLGYGETISRSALRMQAQARPQLMDWPRSYAKHIVLTCSSSPSVKVQRYLGPFVSTAPQAVCPGPAVRPAAAQQTGSQCATPYGQTLSGARDLASQGVPEDRGIGAGTYGLLAAGQQLLPAGCCRVQSETTRVDRLRLQILSVGPAAGPNPTAAACENSGVSSLGQQFQRCCWPQASWRGRCDPTLPAEVLTRLARRHHSQNPSPGPPLGSWHIRRPIQERGPAVLRALEEALDLLPRSQQVPADAGHCVDGRVVLTSSSCV